MLRGHRPPEADTKSTSASRHPSEKLTSESDGTSCHIDIADIEGEELTSAWADEAHYIRRKELTSAWADDAHGIAHPKPSWADKAHQTALWIANAFVNCIFAMATVHRTLKHINGFHTSSFKSTMGSSSRVSSRLLSTSSSSTCTSCSYMCT